MAFGVELAHKGPTEFLIGIVGGGGLSAEQVAVAVEMIPRDNVTAMSHVGSKATVLVVETGLSDEANVPSGFARTTADRVVLRLCATGQSAQLLRSADKGRVEVPGVAEAPYIWLKPAVVDAA